MTEYGAPDFCIPAELRADLEKLGDLLDVGANVVEFGQRLHGEDLIDKPPTSDLKTVAYLLFGKAFKTFQAIQLLARCGCGSDGLSLCAALFENVIDLRYVCQSPDDRPGLFLRFEQVEKYYLARRILRISELPPDVRKQYKSYEENLEPQVRDLLEAYPNETGGWSQQSIRSRAKTVGLELDYLRFYGILCAHKHTGPSAAGQLLTVQGGYTDVIWGPNVVGVYDALVHSTGRFLELCDSFCEVFELECAVELSSLHDKLKRTSREAVEKCPEVCN